MLYTDGKVALVGNQPTSAKKNKFIVAHKGQKNKLVWEFAYLYWDQQKSLAQHKLWQWNCNQNNELGGEYN